MSSTFQNTKLLLSAAYKNGRILRQDHAVPAKVRVETIPSVEKFKELNLRIVVDAADAEELLEGFTSGILSISVEQMLSVVDRVAKA